MRSREVLATRATFLATSSGRILFCWPSRQFVMRWFTVDVRFTGYLPTIDSALLISGRV
jgi:hypothetical protein